MTTAAFDTRTAYVRPTAPSLVDRLRARAVEALTERMAHRAWLEQERAMESLTARTSAEVRVAARRA